MLQIIPTDTCYGLAWALTPEDYLEIYRLKGRDFSKPLALLVRDYDDMKGYIEISDEQIDALREYPHPWSFLGMRKTDYILPPYLDSLQYERLSLRVASVCMLWLDASELEFPLFLTSANRSGETESTTLREARRIFPWVDGIDGGVCDRPPSDIFALWNDGELQYLRRNYE